MRRELVYDLPTRVFHWMFAGLFLTAFVIAKTVDDDSAVFSYHMLAGLSLTFLVALRVIWGFWGTKHARFSSFALHPADLINYFRGVLIGDKTRWAGHNPASSWAAILMMVMAAGLGFTGYLMVVGPDKEAFEDLHELLANGLIVVAILHIAGIVLHTLRHQEVIAFSMIDGKKVGIPANEVIPSAQYGFGVLMTGLAVVFSLHLVNNFDAQTGTLRLMGSTLQLADTEGGDSGANSDGDGDENDEAEDEDED